VIRTKNFGTIAQACMMAKTAQEGGIMKRLRKNEPREPDTARLNDLARQHGLAFKRTGMIY
jgi:hypothetical protein